MTRHFAHPDGSIRAACGVLTNRISTAWNVVTCHRCRATTRWAAACQQSRKADEREAYDEERRSLRGYTDAELERI